MRLLHALLAVAVLTLAVVAVTAHAQGAAYALPSSLALVKGTPGQAVGRILVLGQAPGPTDINWSSCVVNAYPYAAAGFTVEHSSARAWVENGVCKFQVAIDLGGAYDGSEMDWYPVSTIVVGFVNSYGVIERYYYLTWDDIAPLKLTPVSFSLLFSDVGRIGYVVSPNPATLSPGQRFGTVYSFAPGGTVYYTIVVSPPVTVPVAVTFTWSQGGVSHSTLVPLSSSQGSYQVALPDVDFVTPLEYRITYGTIVLLTGSDRVGDHVEITKLGFATVQPLRPQWLTVFQAGRPAYKVYAVVFAPQLQGGRLTVTISTSVGSTTKTLTAPGTTEYMSSAMSTRRDIQVAYTITYTGPLGSSATLTLTTTLKASEYIEMRAFLAGIWYILFFVAVASGMIMLVIGTLLRQLHYHQAGVMMIASGVFVFLVPSIVAYMVKLLVATGLPDPIGLRYMSAADFPEKLEYSILYIHASAMSLGDKLRNIALMMLGVVAGASALGSLGAGILSWLTAGAGQILGRVLGELGAQLVTTSFIAFAASAAIKVLGILFPLFIEVLFAVLVIVAWVEALFAIGSGNMNEVLRPIVNVVMLSIVLLVSPPLLAELEVMATTSNAIHLPGFNVTLPNPFVYIVVSIFESLYLTGLLLLGLNRLLSLAR